MTAATDAIGARAEAMLDALASITAEPGKLTRLYLTPEHKRSADLVGAWMRDAGLAVRMDAVGTMHGVLKAGRDDPHAGKRLLIGSHIDTVVDAGKYDGNMGVVLAILALDDLGKRGVALPFAVEVLAFGDEEGVRFPRTLTSSSAIAGLLDESILEMRDGDGKTLREALAAFGADATRLKAEAYDAADVLGYLEVHIEQGPVLEQAGEPLGVVSAIASQGRYRVTVRGEAGHAGTVPMALRHDALAAAAEAIVAIEAVGREGAKSSLVATVGQMKVSPGASNVIPGAVEFSLDVRAADDDARTAAAAKIRARLGEIGARRGVVFAMETVHEKPVAACAPRLQRAIGAAIESVTGAAPRTLVSGAGHDGQAMVNLTDIGMIFVRCRGGVSHSPLEHVTPADMGLAVAALVRTIEILAEEKGR